MMTPEAHAACVAALAAAEQAAEATEQAAAALRAVLRAGGRSSTDLVPLAVACQAWGVSKETGLKRAQRGLGRKIAGRWHVPSETVALEQHPRDPADPPKTRVSEARSLPSGRV